MSGKDNQEQPGNNKPEEKQTGYSKGQLVGLFVGAVVGIGFNAYMVNDMYQDDLIEAEEMRKEAEYNVRILSSRDGENAKGDDLTAYKLSQDFQISVEACNYDNLIKFDVDLRIRVTGEATARDYFMLPEEWKREWAKKDFRWTLGFNNSSYRRDIKGLLRRGEIPSELTSKIDKTSSFKEAMTAIVQKNDERYMIKSELLDMQMAANSVEPEDRADCAFTTTTIVPVPFYAP